MKALLISLFVVLSFNTMAVEEYCAKQIIILFDGTVLDQVKTENGSIMLSASIPEFYTETSVKLLISKFVSEYSDIFIDTPWKVLEGGAIALTLRISDNYYLYVFYSKSANAMIFIWY